MKRYIFIFLVIVLFNSCGIYSFSGINLEGAETISFRYFDNVAKWVNPQVSLSLYDKMYERFVSQTPLEYVQKNGDLEFSGKIVGYKVKPIDIKAGEVAANNRLTITIHVKYVNFKNPKNNFERNFSWYADYESTQNIADVEDELIDQILDKIVDDMFNASVVNW